MQCFDNKIEELEGQVAMLQAANDEVDSSIEYAADDIVDLVNEAVMSSVDSVMDELGLSFDFIGCDDIDSAISEAITDAVRERL